MGSILGCRVRRSPPVAEQFLLANVPASKAGHEREGAARPDLKDVISVSHYMTFEVAHQEGETRGRRYAAPTAEELKLPERNYTASENVKPSDSIKVHWVYSSCDNDPLYTHIVRARSRPINPMGIL